MIGSAVGGLCPNCHLANLRLAQAIFAPTVGYRYPPLLIPRGLRVLTRARDSYRDHALEVRGRALIKSE